MRLTARQFVWSLGGGSRSGVVTEERLHHMYKRMRNGKGRRQTRGARKRLLFERQAGICPYCGGRMTLDHDRRLDGGYCTEEHVTPLSREDQTGLPRVLVGACRRCNSGRANTPLLIWMWRIHRPVTA